jgi:hypothetical protein
MESHRVYYKGEVVGFPKGGGDAGFPTKGVRWWLTLEPGVCVCSK